MPRFCIAVPEVSFVPNAAVVELEWLTDAAAPVTSSLGTEALPVITFDAVKLLVTVDPLPAANLSLKSGTLKWLLSADP